MGNTASFVGITPEFLKRLDKFFASCHPVTMKKTLILYALCLPLLIVLFDQWSKYAVISSFNAPMNICEITPYPGLKHEIMNLFDFSLVCNQGISWGLLQGDSQFKRWALTIFALGMSGALVYVLTQSHDWLNKLSISLIIGGAIGNGIDRALFGAVTDFIDFSDIGFRWVFNIADSAITVGVIGLIAASFLIKPEEEAEISKT